MFELLFEILGLLVILSYFYHDYKKAKLERWTLNAYIKSWVRGIIILVIAVVLMRILFLD